MREILFRGKRLDNGLWIEGCLRQYPSGSAKICDKEMQHTFKVDPETVGQYTGLIDKNCKKIFEGDILRYAMQYDYHCWEESIEHPELYDDEGYDAEFEYGVVKWFGNADYPAFDIEPHEFESNGLSYLLSDGEYIVEIIGNSHDNPELMGGAENVSHP